MEINSFIIAKHPVVRDALALVLSIEQSFTVKGSAKTVADAMTALGGCCPDVVVWDVDASTEHDARMVQQIRRASPSARVLILAMNSTASYIAQMVHAGVQGYLYKDQASAELPDAIRALVAGQRYLPYDL